MGQKIILVTGGLGFIGKHFIKRCLELGHHVTNVDIINYAADRKANDEFVECDQYRLMEADIALLRHLPEVDFVVNFAAESHVDNSIVDNLQFCHSNVLGVQKLLELTRARGAAAPHFIQISTDEVYGDILGGVHSEEDPLRPSNPYSSTKAAADMLILGWARTYDLRHNILRLSNNYGPHQYPEKLIPRSTLRLIRGLPALMHGDGSYVRSWLHVEDSVSAILTIMDNGETDTIYNICGDTELPNIDVLHRLADLLNVPREDAIQRIDNRVGQDIRYSMDDSRIRALGWSPREDFDESLVKIVNSIDIRRFL
jgi:dTDP-glucose 4,6-dehydratase